VKKPDHDLLRAPSIDVGQEEDRALPGHPNDAVVDAESAGDVVDNVREDQVALFGFATEERRDLFRLLLGLSGVGPKVALAVLATMEPEELRRVVAAEDADALTAIPGIGKRTSQKLMLELKGRLELVDMHVSSTGGPSSEVRDALSGLGYGADEIRDAMRHLPVDLPVEELLRLSLRELGRP